MFTPGVAAKTKALDAKSIQVRWLAIGSYSRLLTAGFFPKPSEGYLDKCLSVLPHYLY